MRQFSSLEQRLLNEFQHGMPLTPNPYADIARQLGVYETTVLETLQRLQTEGVVSRVGAVFRPNRIGASTLAAIAVPAAELEEVAAMVSEFTEVNHNYEREHRFNLWFVVVADDEDRLETVLAEIEERSGYPVLDLPLLNEYFIDLGFDLKWT
jgi:DNA-binding Lrp family transcriptional regulator